MYIVYNEIKYPCNCRPQAGHIVYRGLPEDFPSSVRGIIALHADDGFLLRKDTIEDYLRCTFSKGTLTLTNTPESIVYDPTLEELKTSKLEEISRVCNTAIISGVDVETTQGVEHFSLEETDQINLNAAFTAIQQGATSYPYHADKQLCRMFSADEILAIVNAGTQHKLYHTTLCNHILVWIRRAETKEELQIIAYSADNLPEDLVANMQSILASTVSV